MEGRGLLQVNTVTGKMEPGEVKIKATKYEEDVCETNELWEI